MVTLRCALVAAVLLWCAGPMAGGSAASAPRPGPPGVAAAAPAVGRAWPVGDRPAVVRGWLPPASAYGRGHRGVDLATARGAPVRAAAGGRVSFAGKVAGRGVVSIALSGTGTPPLRTTYEPVVPLVARGDAVRAGQVVARVSAGPYHCAAACLHWGLLRAGAYLDPLSLLPPGLLRRGPSRLLPLWGQAGPAMPLSAVATAASAISPGSSAAPSSMRRTAASTMPWRSIAARRGLRWPRSPSAATTMATSPPWAARIFSRAPSSSSPAEMATTAR